VTVVKPELNAIVRSILLYITSKTLCRPVDRYWYVLKACVLNQRQAYECLYNQIYFQIWTNTNWV